MRKAENQEMLKNLSYNSWQDISMPMWVIRLLGDLEMQDGTCV